MSGNIFKIPLRKKQSRGRENPGPRVADGQHLQEPLQRSLLVTLCVEETYKLSTSPSQGQGWWVWQERGSLALISASVQRLSFVSTAPSFPIIY